MEMEPAVEKESGSNGEGNEGPGDTALLGCGKGKRRTSTSSNSTLRGLPQNAGVILPRSAEESLSPHLGGHSRQRRPS